MKSVEIYFLSLLVYSQDDYINLMSVGKEVISDHEGEPQYMFLEQRLQSLQQGWEELQVMWNKQDKLLKHAKEYQTFARDCELVRKFFM